MTLDQDLDPWDSAEQHAATAPPQPAHTSHRPGGAGGAGGSRTAPAQWTVFPEASPAAAPRSAWAPPVSAPKPSNYTSTKHQNINNNAFNGYPPYKRFQL